MSNLKKFVRDIQDRTGWKYQFAHYLVSTLGYEEVSKAVDDANGCFAILGNELNASA